MNLAIKSYPATAKVQILSGAFTPAGNSNPGRRTVGEILMVAEHSHDFSLFVSSDIDDYGLDPYEFRIYARISRRAGRGDAWESIPKMASACQISERRVRRALRLLEAVGLIESVKRPGRSTIYRLTPNYKWTNSKNLETIRASLTPIKAKTSSRSDSGSKAVTPIQSEVGVVSDLILPPLSKVKDEGLPLKGDLTKVLPLDLSTTQKESSGGEEKFLLGTEDKANILKSVSTVSPVPKSIISQYSDLGNDLFSAAAVPSCKTQGQQLSNSNRQNHQSTILSTSPGTTNFGTRSTRLSDLSKPKKTSTSKPPLETLERTDLLTELSRIVNEPLENLRLNTNLASVLDRYPGNVEQALEYFKQAIASWKNRPGIGLFISAVKHAQKPCLQESGNAWSEWVQEAESRCLFQYSEACQGDILITFNNGAQYLWSELRSLSWSEIEALVLGHRQASSVDYSA